MRTILKFTEDGNKFDFAFTCTNSEAPFFILKIEEYVNKIKQRYLDDFTIMEVEK